jgi:hypothetical protein
VGPLTMSAPQIGDEVVRLDSTVTTVQRIAGYAPKEGLWCVQVPKETGPVYIRRVGVLARQHVTLKHAVTAWEEIKC